MKTLATTTDIAATPAAVWPVLSDIERWPEWTPTIVQVDRLDSKPLMVGSKVRVFQPKLPPTVWTISLWEENHGFSWISRRPGTQVVAEHLLSPTGDGCMLTLRVHFQGLLGSVVGIIAGKLTQRYIETEAAGLKRHCELGAK